MTERDGPPVVSPEDLRERLASLREGLERLRLDTERRWAEMVSLLATRSEEILHAAAPVPGAPEAVRGLVSIESARRLDRATGQVEILARLLEECLRHASRAVLLVERRSRIEPWKSVGFRSPPEARKPLPENAALDAVREGRPKSLGAGNPVSAGLGAGDAAAAVLLPFVVKEKVSGALYADAVEGEQDRFDEEALAFLAHLAATALDRLARRRLVPSPALREAESDAELPAAPVPEADGTEAPAAQPPSERALAGPLAPSPGIERGDEARRFARLLATEIKLYNEQAVVEGLERGNLADRLKDEIDRGRRLYEERVPAHVRSEADYYRQELVDVLAGGRSEALQ